MMNLYKKYEEQILYIVFGVCTTLVNIITYIGLAKFMGINSFKANVIAWIISVLFAYVTNKIWVFKSYDYRLECLMKEIISFVSARAVSGLLDIAIMFVFVQQLLMNDIVVKLASNVLVVILNYIFSKIYIFKKEME